MGTRKGGGERILQDKGDGPKMEMLQVEKQGAQPL